MIQAAGREHPALSPQDEQRGDFDANWIVPFQPINNGQVLQNYTQQFAYDDAGNLYRIQHQGATAWVRTLTVSDSANRAVDSALTDKPAEVDSCFDGNGNQTRMAGLQAVAWNYRNNIASVTVIQRQNAPSDGEYYVYDSAGNRVRKVTEQYGNGGTVAHIEETLYLGTLEIKRITQGSTITEERHSLRVMDDMHAVATQITWTQGNPPAGVQNPQLRYQLDNHLGSATREVDKDGQIISYEEYIPYGGTSLVAGRNASEVQLKQYRYSGKERDSVTGFYYYGARYYAPWLGRWMSADPAGTVDGLNLYAFVGGNPVTYRDLKGEVKDPSEEKDPSTEQQKGDINLKSLKEFTFIPVLANAFLDALLHLREQRPVTFGSYLGLLPATTGFAAWGGGVFGAAYYTLGMREHGINNKDLLGLLSSTLFASEGMLQIFSLHLPTKHKIHAVHFRIGILGAGADFLKAYGAFKDQKYPDAMVYLLLGYGNLRSTVEDKDILKFYRSFARRVLNTQKTFSYLNREMFRTAHTLFKGGIRNLGRIAFGEKENILQVYMRGLRRARKTEKNLSFLSSKSFRVTLGIAREASRILLRAKAPSALIAGFMVGFTLFL